MNQSDTHHKFEILGHRGAKRIAPENTLASFQAAIDAGVNMIELDVHLSRDGKLVVIHDPALERTTDGQGMVGDHDLKTLKSFNAAAQFDGSMQFGIQRIPTLQEVYNFVGKQVALNIEIKTRADGSRYPGIEEQVLAVIQHNQSVSTTLVSSFDFPTVQKVQELEPGLCCSCIISTKYFNQMAEAGKTNQDIINDLTRQGFQQVAVSKESLSKELMHLLKQANFIVCAWIIDDVDEMLAYMEMGVDRITTDCPHILVPAYQIRSPHD